MSAQAGIHRINIGASETDDDEKEAFLSEWGNVDPESLIAKERKLSKSWSSIFCLVAVMIIILCSSFLFNYVVCTSPVTHFIPFIHAFWLVFIFWGCWNYSSFTEKYDLRCDIDHDQGNQIVWKGINKYLDYENTRGWKKYLDITLFWRIVFGVINIISIFVFYYLSRWIPVEGHLMKRYRNCILYNCFFLLVSNVVITELCLSSNYREHIVVDVASKIIIGNDGNGKIHRGVSIEKSAKFPSQGIFYDQSPLWLIYMNAFGMHLRSLLVILVLVECILCLAGMVLFIQSDGASAETQILTGLTCICGIVHVVFTSICAGWVIFITRSTIKGFLARVCLIAQRDEYKKYEDEKIFKKISFLWYDMDYQSASRAALFQLLLSWGAAIWFGIEYLKELMDK